MKKLIAVVLASFACFAGSVTADMSKNPSCVSGGVDFCRSTGGASSGGGE